jgi:hypothetical protein
MLERRGLAGMQALAVPSNLYAARAARRGEYNAVMDKDTRMAIDIPQLTKAIA